MKVISAIVCLALLSSCYALSSIRKIPSVVIDTSFLNTETQKKASFAQLTTAMQQLRDVSEIVSFLDELLQEVAQLRIENLAIIEQTRAQCSEEQAFREGAVTEGERSAESSRRQLAVCAQQKSQSESLNAQAASALATDQQELQDTNDKREADRRVFAEQQKELENLLNNLVQLNALLDNYEAAGAGSLTNSMFIQSANSLLKNSISTGHSHLVLPMYTTLLQVHAKQAVDEDALQQIRDIVATISAEAAQTHQDNVDNDNEAEARYQAKVALLQNLINVLANQVSATVQHAAAMDQCIASEESISALSDDKVARNQELLAASQELCTQSEEKWRVSEVSRTKEVNIINLLKAAISKVEGAFEEEFAPKAGDLVALRMF